MGLTAEDIVRIIMTLAPELFKSYADRVADAAISEFVRTFDPPMEEEYTFEKGRRETVAWKHILVGEENVIGIGERVKVKDAQRVRRNRG
jgi:hypothetical protein